MENKKLLQTVAKKMKDRDPKQIKILMGFDGFVDQVLHVVDKRYDAEHFERVNYMEDYGKKICKAAGLSLNVEMVPVQTKLGGNGPIMANSLARHGCKMNYIGSLGKENVHPVFHEFTENVHAISISDPGFTDAIEFLDGKIISGKLEALKEVSWETIVEKVGIKKFAELIEESDLIGFENWTMLLNTTEIWNHIIREIVPNLKKQERKVLFIDLADPEKRMKEDILEALECLKTFDDTFETILGLNEKESYEIAELYGKSKEDFENVLEVAEFLKGQIQISEIVIHPVKEASGCSRKEKASVQGPYCEKPKLTTGAGDNFNAGFILGRMLGFDLEESLLMGTANSGFYVREARSATYQELQQFIENWSENKLEA